MRDEEGQDRPPPSVRPADEHAALSRVAVSSFLWAFAGLAGNRLVVFVSTVLLARLLVPEDFGVVAAALVLLNFASILMDLGLGAAIVQEQAVGYGPRLDTAFTSQVLLAAGVTVAMVLAAQPLADSLGIADHANVVRVLSFHVLVRALGLTHESLVRRDLRFRARTKVSLLQAGVRFVASVGLAAAGAGVWALVVGTLLSESASTIANWVITRYRPRLVIHREDFARLVRFGGAVTILQVVSAVMASVDYVVIGGRLGAVALGFYVMAFRLPELVISNVLEVFSKVAFPVLSRARSRSMNQVREGVSRSLQLVTLFGFTTGTGLAVASHDIVHVVFGDEWAPSAAPMVLVALAMGVGSIGFGVGDVYLAMGRPWLRLSITGTIVVPMSIAMFVAAGRTITAVAWVHLIAAVIFAVAELALARRIIHLPWSTVARSLRGPAAAAAAIALAKVPIALVFDRGAIRLTVLVVLGVAAATAAAYATDRALVATTIGLARSRAR